MLETKNLGSGWKFWLFRNFMPPNNGSLTPSSGDMYYSMYTKCSSGACVSLHVIAKTKPSHRILSDWDRTYENILLNPASSRFCNCRTTAGTKPLRVHPDDHAQKLPLCMHTHQHLRVPAHHFNRALEVCSLSHTHTEHHSTKKRVIACLLPCRSGTTTYLARNPAPGP
jgi:hypothetical protein